MKTLALTLAASLIASTSAFAGLFDVNDGLQSGSATFAGAATREQ